MKENQNSISIEILKSLEPDIKILMEDPDRLSLLNELKTYENVANKMQSKLK